MVELALIVASWVTAYVVGFWIGRLRTQADYVQRDMQRLVEQVGRFAQPRTGAGERRTGPDVEGR